MRRRGSHALGVALVWLLAGVAARGDARAAADKKLRVASKAFTESVILAEIVSQLERAAGVQVEQRTGLGGSRLVWDALVSGAIDVYPEYTGTLVDEILGTETGASDGHDRAWLVRALAAHGVGMTEPLGFNNTYAVGVRAARAHDLGLSRLSDLRVENARGAHEGARGVGAARS